MSIDISVTFDQAMTLAKNITKLDQKFIFSSLLRKPGLPTGDIRLTPREITLLWVYSHIAVRAVVARDTLMQLLEEYKEDLMQIADDIWVALESDPTKPIRIPYHKIGFLDSKYAIITTREGSAIELDTGETVPDPLGENGRYMEQELRLFSLTAIIMARLSVLQQMRGHVQHAPVEILKG